MRKGSAKQGGTAKEKNKGETWLSLYSILTKFNKF